MLVLHEACIFLQQIPPLLQRYGRDDSGPSTVTLIIIALVVIVVFRFITLLNRPFPPTGHWHHHFENFNYSSKDFYGAIAQAVREKEIPGVSMQMVTYAEGGLFSMNREYLRITRNRMIFDVCAAPFAKGFFVSWWQSSLPTLREVLIALIPSLGKTKFRYGRDRTYFEIDTENMFKDSFHESIVKAVDAITTAKGLRKLSAEDRLVMMEPVL